MQFASRCLNWVLAPALRWIWIFSAGYRHVLSGSCQSSCPWDSSVARRPSCCVAPAKWPKAPLTAWRLRVLQGPAREDRPNPALLGFRVFGFFFHFARFAFPVLAAAVVAAVSFYGNLGEVLYKGFENVNLILKEVDGSRQPPDAFSGDPLTHLFLLIVAKIFLTAVCQSSGQVGGLFAPALFIGACLGGLVGRSLRDFLWPWALWLPELPIFKSEGPFVFSVPATYAIVGMAACLGSICNVPLTAVVLLLELAGGKDYGVVLPTVAAVGTLSSKRDPYSLVRCCCKLGLDLPDSCKVWLCTWKTCCLGDTGCQRTPHRRQKAIGSADFAEPARPRHLQLHAPKVRSDSTRRSLLLVTSSGNAPKATGEPLRLLCRCEFAGEAAEGLSIMNSHSRFAAGAAARRQKPKILRRLTVPLSRRAVLRSPLSSRCALRRVLRCSQDAPSATAPGNQVHAPGSCAARATSTRPRRAPRRFRGRTTLEAFCPELLLCNGSCLCRTCHLWTPRRFLRIMQPSSTLRPWTRAAALRVASVASRPRLLGLVSLADVDADPRPR